MTNHTQPFPNRDPWLRRPIVLMTISVLVLVGLRMLPVLSQVLLLIFGAVVVAILLDGVSTWGAEHTFLPRWLILVLFVFLAVVVVAAAGWFMGERISSQLTQLSDRVSEGIEQLRKLREEHRWIRRWVPTGKTAADGLISSDLWLRAGGIFSNAVGAVVNVLILLVIAVYLAFNPSFYLDQTLRLTPPAKRPRYREVSAALGSALRWWFIGRFSSMAVIGVLTWIGLWIAQVPLALPLGLIAGILSFVPFVGPIAAAIPGVIVAWMESPMTAVYAVLVYLIVQALEGNLITPLIQKHAVSVPPALLIVGQLVLGSLLGFWGVLWATPLVVAAMVIVRMLYQEDVLHEPAPSH